MLPCRMPREPTFPPSTPQWPTSAPKQHQGPSECVLPPVSPVQGLCPKAASAGPPVPAQLGCYLLVGQGVHVANNLGCHLARVRGPVLEGSLDDGHDEGQGRGINEVDKLGVQQGLQALLGLPGRVRQGIQQDGGNGCIPKQRGTGESESGQLFPGAPVPSSGSQPVCREQSCSNRRNWSEAVAASSLHCRAVLWRSPCGQASMGTELLGLQRELLRHHNPYPGSSNPKWFCDKLGKHRPLSQ